MNQVIISLGSSRGVNNNTSLGISCQPEDEGWLVCISCQPDEGWLGLSCQPDEGWLLVCLDAQAASFPSSPESLSPTHDVTLGIMALCVQSDSDEDEDDSDDDDEDEDSEEVGSGAACKSE